MTGLAQPRDDVPPAEVEREGAPARDGRGVERLIGRLRRKYGGRVTGELVMPARPGDFADFPGELDPRLDHALRGRGIARLYSHQRQAWEAVGRGRHTVVVTPTASGKTLCYNLPVLQAVLRDRAKALYLFPTKALSQDQVAEILELNQAGDLGVRAYTFVTGPQGPEQLDLELSTEVVGDVVLVRLDSVRSQLPGATRTLSSM